MKNLKMLREEKRLNQAGLAMELNTSQASISAWERGGRIPDIEAAARIADSFDVSVDYLLGRSQMRRELSADKLTPLESSIMLNLRKLDENKQRQVDAFIQGLLAQ